MAELPTGTVTFLFTDVEGSTLLLQELGDRYATVRDDHAAIVRRAIAEGGGVEVSTEGDSFFAAFPTPVATWEGHHEDAIRLAGASEALDELAGAGRTSGFAGLLEGDAAAEARLHVTEDAAGRVREEGLAMSIEEAMALVREEEA